MRATVDSGVSDVPYLTLASSLLTVEVSHARLHPPSGTG